MREPQLVGSILVGADDLVSNLVASRIPHMRNVAFGPHTTLGVVRDGTLIGGVVYHGYRQGVEVQVSIAFERGGFLPWRALFAYPFNELGVPRITAIVGRKNKPSRKLVEKLGFTLEGMHPKGIDGIEDAFSYGLLKENCRWIKDRTNGQVSTAGARAA